jgi:hypothetical protein
MKYKILILIDFLYKHFLEAKNFRERVIDINNAD